MTSHQPSSQPGQEGETKTSLLEAIKLPNFPKTIILDPYARAFLLTITQIPANRSHKFSQAYFAMTSLNATRDEIAEMATAAVNRFIVAAPSIGPFSVKKPIESFRLFKSLPVEIRVQIWSLNIPGPRIVEVKLMPRTKELSMGNLSSFQCTKNPQIANLAVCQESRYEALKVFSLAFPDRLSPGRLMVNFSTDTVLFNCLRLLPKSTSSTLHSTFCQITHLALTENTAKHITKGFFTCFPCLQEILLVDDQRSHHTKYTMEKFKLKEIGVIQILQMSAHDLQVLFRMDKPKRIIEAAYAAYNQDKGSTRPLKILYTVLFN